MLLLERLEYRLRAQESVHRRATQPDVYLGVFGIKRVHVIVRLERLLFQKEYLNLAYLHAHQLIYDQLLLHLLQIVVR